MRRLWVLAVFSLALYGADVSGKWSGNIEVTDPTNGEKINTPVKAEFDQKESAISGKIGRTEDENPEPIRNGKVDGKNLVFEVKPAEATSPMKFSLTVVTDDRIEGEMKGAIDVGNISGKVTLKKMK